MYFTSINSLQNFKCSVYVYKLKKKYYDLYFILIERILSHNMENKKRSFIIGLIGMNFAYLF